MVRFKRSGKFLICLLSLWLALAGNLQAQSSGIHQDILESAQRAVRLKDFAKAVFFYQTLAQEGDPDAQYQLAVFYESGKGIAEDQGQAFYWFEKSAKQGNARAQYNLGVMYENGWGTAQDYQQALKFYNLAALQNYGPALDKKEFIKAHGLGPVNELNLSREDTVFGSCQAE